MRLKIHSLEDILQFVNAIDFTRKFGICVNQFDVVNVGQKLLNISFEVFRLNFFFRFSLWQDKEGI